MKTTTVRHLAAPLLLSVPLALTALPLQAQPMNSPPQTTVSSFIGLINELQKRGPNAYVLGPAEGGRYVVVGPLDAPPYRPLRNRRSRHTR